MKRSFSFVILTFILAMTFLAASAGGGVTPVEPLAGSPVADGGGEMVQEASSGLWFVELSNAPTADGTSRNAILKEQNAFRNAAGKAGINYTERFAFQTLWNGFSVRVDAADVSKLAALPGVKGVYPVELVSIPETIPGGDPDLGTALTMTGADIAQSELGYTGSGIKVAVMDTGIDYDHPDLGGCFGPGCRVAYGYDLVGDDFNADSTSPTYNPIPNPDPDPDDCNGHGTHVSGIVGANGTVVGVAPNVTFGAYRVFGCVGSTTADIMIAAMEMALADDMDVLNMSIGSAFTWPQYPTSKAASRLVNRGMVVVASIGNSGSSGLYAAGSPGLGENVIGVASYDNTHVLLTYFDVNDTHIGFVPMSFAGPTPTSGTEEIVFVGQGCNADPHLEDPSGKVALISRGTCSFNEKATNAINAGATGVVVHNNVPGVFNGTLGTPIDGVTPVVGISLEDGLFIRDQIAPVSMTWTDQQDSFPSPTGGLISSFSSYGLSPDLALKPDIGAPGGNIYSTYPLEAGGFATLGGTSMSSPHVAGGAALYLQARPGTEASLVRDILQNSADPAVWSLNPALGFLDHVHRQGAGMLDIDDAIQARTLITPGKLALGESEGGPATHTLTVANNSGSDVTYDLSYVNALTTGGTIAPSFFLSDAVVSFSSSTLTVSANSTATVDVTISPATDPDLGQYGGYVVFTPQEGGQSYTVPFAGFVGDYQGITVYTFGPFLTDSALNILGDGVVFDMTDADNIPYFAVHLEHQVPTFKVQIFQLRGPYWFLAYDEAYFPRNSSAGSVFLFPFDGTTFRGNTVYTVPDGRFYAVVSVLKANGDARNPAHWESWTSPVFVIDRP
jgi:minor extracellular serine protease Vpr